MKSWWIVAAAGVLGLGWLWLQQDRQHTREVAFLQTSVDSLDTALGLADTRQRARERQDSALSDSVALWRSRAASVRIRVDTLQVRVVAQESVFVTQLPDSLKAQFLALSTLQDSVVRGLKLQVADLTAALEAQAKVSADRLVTVHDLTGELAAALKQRDAALRLSHPGILTRILREVPVILTTAGAVLILRP